MSQLLERRLRHNGVIALHIEEGEINYSNILQFAAQHINDSDDDLVYMRTMTTCTAKIPMTTSTTLQQQQEEEQEAAHQRRMSSTARRHRAQAVTSSSSTSSSCTSSMTTASSTEEIKGQERGTT